MFKRTIISLSLLTACYLPLAQASWKTTVERDIFSSSDNAALVADITNHNESVIVECKSGVLTISQVEQDSATKVKGNIAYKTLIEVPDNNPIEFNTVLNRRNANDIQLTSTEAPKIKQLLQQILTQSSSTDFLIGDVDKNGKHVSSASGSVSFAKKAVKEFVSACHIEV